MVNNYFYYNEYIDVGGAPLFTFIGLPEKDGKFPTVIFRSPYVDAHSEKTDKEVCDSYFESLKVWMARGYAVVYQHCRGRGKSGGDCIPYINERRDGLALWDWIRAQSFYNGEIYLWGSSYTTSVHYVTAPFAPDIKGAIFTVQDSERYNVCYRNGCMKKGLHGTWYVSMYKAKTMKQKNYDENSFEMLPLSDFTTTVFGESSADFDEMLRSPHPTDPFWQTHNGGADARGATEHANIPILLVTSLNDIYTGGVFDMWNAMDEATKAQSALVVSAYNHGDTYNAEKEIVFENARRVEKFGAYELDWLDHIRGIRTESPFEKGKVTYYSIFENTWKTDDFSQPDGHIDITLGEGERSYVYDPDDAPSFKGGLSRAFGGTEFQDAPGLRDDIITVYTEPFEKDTVIRGKITARLKVKSDCEDTCFYFRVSLETERGDYGLRDDITTLGHALGTYIPGTWVTLDFECDEHALKIEAGRRLRIDIASADKAHYVRHTNYAGLYSEQTKTRKANNTVDLGVSKIVLPIVNC